MPVVGVGIDVVDVARFGEALARTPALREKLFTEAEATRPLASLAARAWHDAEIVSEDSGRPRFELRGTVAARAEALGAQHVHVSLSHDAGIASAVVVLEG